MARLEGLEPQGPGKVVHESAREYCRSVLRPAVTFAEFEQAVMVVTSIAHARGAATRGPWRGPCGRTAPGAGRLAPPLCDHVGVGAGGLNRQQMPDGLEDVQAPVGPPGGQIVDYGTPDQRVLVTPQQQGGYGHPVDRLLDGTSPDVQGGDRRAEEGRDGVRQAVRPGPYLVKFLRP